MTNFEVLQEYEKAGVPLPRLEGWKALKEENARIKLERDKFAYDLGVSDATNWALLRLLKEVKEFIEEENPKDYTIMSERMDELLTKIEEVLK